MSQHRCLRTLAAPLLLLLLLTARTDAATAGSWTPVSAGAPDAISTMLLLTDGSVLAQGYYSTAWYRLTPDAQGSYVHGTWSTVAPMHDSRLYYFSVVMRDGRVLVGGGEYGTGGSTVEVYDPIANTWTRVSSWTTQVGVGIDDSTAKVLDDGRVLVFPYLSNCGYLYDPTADSWTATATKLSEGYNDEESVVHLPNGDFFMANCDDGTVPHGSQRYKPSTNAWVSCGTVPVNLVDAGAEIGPFSLLYDGSIFCLGATGQTALWNAATSDPTDVLAGTWTAGTSLPTDTHVTPNASYACDDAPSAIMPNGRVLFVADGDGWNPPSAVFEYDPVAQTYISVASPSSVLASLPAFTERMLVLPTGQVLMSEQDNQVYVYTPTDAPQDAWRPTVTAVTDLQNGTFEVTGTQLNGLVEGASYGDDAQMATNYPLVRLTSTVAPHPVYWGRTFGFSTMGVATGSQSVTAAFSPGTAPNGSYTLAVIASGVASAETAFTLAQATAAPVITSTAPTAGTVNGLYTYQVTATGTPQPTFSVANAPSGMQIDATSGYVTWYPSAAGYITFDIIASNGIAPDADQQVTVAVPGAPRITSTPVTTAVVGQRYQYTVTVGDPPAPTYSLTTAPATMSIGASSGVITWTPSQVGTVTVTVAASNGYTPNASQSYQIVVDAAPAITSTPVLTVGVHQPYSYQVTATGTPAPTFSLATAPSWLSITSAGALTGTAPTDGAAAVTVVASNGILPNATQSFTIGVTQAPQITSTPPATAAVGQAYTTTVVATGYPAPTFSLSGAPAGMSLDATTGALSWTPTAAGTVHFTILAANGILPQASQQVTVVVDTAPSITSTAITLVALGTTYTYPVTATGAPTPTFSLTAPPPGMSIGTTTGVITWTPSATGSYPITVVASNGVPPDATQAFTLVVGTGAAWTSQPTLLIPVGQPYTYQATASGSPPPTYALTTHPAGMTIDPATGILQWTPTQVGNANVTITASNGVTAAITQQFTLVVGEAPVITSTPLTTILVGQVYQTTITATAYPAATFSLGTAPGGMTIDPASGVITWSCSAGGLYAVSVLVSDGIDPVATQTFSIAVDAPPAFGQALPATATLRAPFTPQLSATGYPTPTYALVSGPPGLTVAPSGAVSWTPTTPGTYQIAVTASNGIAPTASATYTVTVADTSLITTASGSSGGGQRCGIGSIAVVLGLLLARRRRRR